MTDSSAGARQRLRLRLQRKLRLQTRLLLISAGVLAACLGSVGWTLDRAYNETVVAAAEEELRAICYGLLGLFEEREGSLVATHAAEPRLQERGSGYYAFVEYADGAPLWRSPTLLAAGGATGQPLPKRPAVGEFHFEAGGGVASQFVAAYTANWEQADVATTLWVLAAPDRYRAQMADGRRRIVGGLGAAAGLFVLAQLAALAWGMRPLRRMARRVRALEAGDREGIGSDYPPELSPLAHNLNRFIAAEKTARERYRRAMDDLAHSLKTPLAVLKNALREPGSPPTLLGDQVQRMTTAIGYQLSRAAAAPQRTVAGRVALAPLAVRIVRALERAWPAKTAVVDLPAPASAATLAVRGDERDLMELLGNLIENAFKYGETQVRVSLRGEAGSLTVAVEDDGPGVPPTHRKTVLQRGVRADAATEGQGLGLAIAAELAEDYGGRLTIADSAALGGAKFLLALPAHPVPTYRGAVSSA